MHTKSLIQKEKMLLVLCSFVSGTYQNGEKERSGEKAFAVLPART